MKQEIETYGKQNFLKREYNNIKSFYVVDPRNQELMKALHNIELYAPGIKRWKLSVGLILIGMCTITLGTNWMIAPIYKWVTK